MRKPVVSSPLRRAFPLVAILLLTACDAPQLLPPDARLPDGSTYSGDIQDGYFHGEGVQEFASGMVYTGQFQEGYWHGDGELESPAGWHYEGEFQKGTMSGQGVIEDDGSRYEGEFRNGEFHGEGRYEAGGSVYIAEFEDGEPVEGKHVTDYGTYEGEFRDWYYHGEGSYAFTGESEDLGSLTGTWEFGEFVDQEEYVAEAPVPEEPALFTETILVEDRRRLNNQIESLAPEQAEAADAYFLAVGGDGTESVFMRDIQVAKTGLQAQFDVENRAIMLLNHRDYETFPLATRPSIASALEALDAQMNPEGRPARGSPGQPRHAKRAVAVAATRYRVAEPLAAGFCGNAGTTERAPKIAGNFGMLLRPMDRATQGRRHTDHDLRPGRPYLFRLW